MRFETQEERINLIASFAAKAKELEAAKIADTKRDMNYNCRVDFDTRTDYDSNVTGSFVGRDFVPNTKDADGNLLPCSGDIYLFIIHQPNLMQALQILNAARPPLGNPYNSGLEAWKYMIDTANSSPEIQTDRIKLGYLLDLVGKLDAILGDQKKN